MLDNFKAWREERKQNKKPGPTLFSIVCFVIMAVLMGIGAVRFIASGQATVKGVLVSVISTLIIAGLAAFSIYKFIKLRRDNKDE